jgi:rRNA maturation endonuclease Nob1
MPGLLKYKEYMRTCKRCQQVFMTTYSHGVFCAACSKNKKNKKHKNNRKTYQPLNIELKELMGK